MKRILFVCTGNSCRSVMAAEMLKNMISTYSDKIEVLSAGTGTTNGMKASDHTLTVLAKEGIDAAGHRSMLLTKELVEKVDLILVMERFHKYRVLEMSPGTRGKVHVLREFQKDLQDVIEPEVPDPIGKPLEVYERSFDLIKEGLENLVKWIKANGWLT